jgi:hypothetical protein
MYSDKFDTQIDNMHACMIDTSFNIS